MKAGGVSEGKYSQTLIDNSAEDAHNISK